MERDERLLLRAFLDHLKEGKVPTNLSLSKRAGLSPSLVSPGIGRLQALGYLIRDGREYGRLRTSPSAWTDFGEAPPRLAFNETNLTYATKPARAALPFIRQFFDTYYHLPSPTDLAPLLGVSRQRAHQLLRELGRLEVIPAETRRARKEA